jgi:ribonuclease J
VGRVCIDSGAVGEVVGDMVIRDRKVIAEDGIVIPIIAINKHTGKIESTELVSRGFGLDHDPGFMASARESVERTLEGSSPEEISDWGVVKEKIRADLKRFISREAQRRPLIMPVILEI